MDRRDYDVLMIILAAVKRRRPKMLREQLLRTLMRAGHTFELDAALDQLTQDGYLIEKKHSVSVTKKALRLKLQPPAGRTDHGARGAHVVWFLNGQSGFTDRANVRLKHSAQGHVGINIGQMPRLS